MKVAPKVILLFKDADGFATAISAEPSPNSKIHILKESFELSLESYGIKDRKASGKIIHFLNAKEIYEVSILLLENYEPPLLACALNEVLASLARDNSSSVPTLVVPFIVEASKLKLDNKNAMANSKASVYGLQLGPRTDLIESLLSTMQKPPPTLQIHHECLALSIQLLRVLGLPTFVLIGQTGRHTSRKTSNEDLEVIYEIGEKLASFSSLSFSREKIIWNPIKSSPTDTKEPWRALYG